MIKNEKLRQISAMHTVFCIVVVLSVGLLGTVQMLPEVHLGTVIGLSSAIIFVVVQVGRWFTRETKFVLKKE